MIELGKQITDRSETINLLCRHLIETGKMKNYINTFENGVVSINDTTSVMYISTDKVLKHNTEYVNGKTKYISLEFRTDSYNNYCLNGQGIESVLPADYSTTLINKRINPNINYVVYRPVYNNPDNPHRICKYYVMKGTFRVADVKTLPTGQTRILYLRTLDGAVEI